MQYDEEDDIMAILQEQNGALAQKRRMAKQKEKGVTGCWKTEYGERTKKKQKLNMLGLVESKLQVVTKFDVIYIWGNDAVGKKGQDRLTVFAEDFKGWVQDMQLVDLPFYDRQFTWFRSRSCSCIDRVLVSVEWTEEFSEIRLKGGPRGLSDHCPIIVEHSKFRSGQCPFRSLDSWFTHDGFLRMVREEWRNLGEVQFTDKLKALTLSLGRWHKDNFGDMDKKIQRFEEKIKKIDEMAGNGVYDGTVQARRKTLERSPVVEFRDGLVNRIDEENSVALQRMLTMEEVREAVWDCESSKAPRSNGYNMNFIKKCWDEIAPKFTGAKEIKDLKPISMVKWSFVDIVLQKIGFVWRWREWVKECVGTASMSILINGSPSKPFKMERGLRQGDPLSPFLFVLVVDVLHRMLGDAVRNRCISPLLVGKDNIELSHLQFVDDTILFCPPEEKTIKNYARLLRCFELMSGLSINFDKSSLISINYDQQ
ncbi:uncharacterized protein [Arachis hypogaea]|uniref:uncharacterized protein n=1 Tax=Arachis hypogaea TaxID=3818 RepID=UPI003B216A67